MINKTYKVEDLRELLYDNGRIKERRITGQCRWFTYERIVFEDGGEFYTVDRMYGSTESQEPDLEYDEDFPDSDGGLVSCPGVILVDLTVKDWVKVGSVDMVY